MRGVTAYTGAVVGIVAAWIVAHAVPPAVGIAVGATVTAGGLVVAGEQPRYALAGTVFAVGFGALIYLTNLPAEYGRTPLLALVGFGSVSAAIVGVRSLGKRGVARVATKTGVDEASEDVYDAVSAGAGTLTMAWTVVTAKEKAARYSGVASAGTAGFVLSVLGIDIPIPFWILEDCLNVTMVVFVGSVVTGFHLLSTLAASFRVAKLAGAKGKGAGAAAASTAAEGASTAATTGREAAGRLSDAASEKAGTASDTTSDAADDGTDVVDSVTDAAGETTSEAAEKTSAAVSGAKDRIDALRSGDADDDADE